MFHDAMNRWIINDLFFKWGIIMPKILIDSLDKRMTIPIVNYYHEKGYKIDGICFEGSKSLSKKYINKIHYISKQNVEKDLKEIVEEYSKEDYLVAGNPKVIEAINNINPSIKYIIPSLDSINDANDKRKLMEIAAQLSVKVPKELKEPQYPMIIKLNRSEGIALRPSDRYKIVRNNEEYEKSLESFNDYRENIIFQEFVEGKPFGVSMLFDYESNLVDYIVHERILEYPISGGPSSLCRSIYNEQLVRKSSKLLKKLNWRGLAMVEFKGDTLLEINPRFWGSLPLIFIAESNMFENLIKILDITHNNISEDEHCYKADRYMSYFPQCWVSIIFNIKSGNIEKVKNAMPKVFKSKEGILKSHNMVPFLRYQRTLIRNER